MIEADGALLLSHFQVSNAEALLAIDGYKEAFSLVSACARLVDGLVSRFPDPEIQARESVRLLRRMLDDGEFRKRSTQRASDRKGPALPASGTPRQAVYDKKKSILEWRDFFVSYTNRDAPAINDQFRQLIRSCLGQAPRGTENQSNYVAVSSPVTCAVIRGSLASSMKTISRWERALMPRSTDTVREPLPWCN